MKLKPLVTLLTAAFAAPLALAANGVVISQVYGGGGNASGIYKNDYIELFNSGSSDVSLAGWSVQYASGSASSAGTSWAVTALPSVTLKAGQYLLVQQASGGSGGSLTLPTPDKVGSSNMGGSAGKVVLASTTTAFTVAKPAGASVIDFLGYGSSANASEGSNATAPNDTLALFRANAGCTDTDNNNADFATGTPAPRNSASPLNICSGGTTPPADKPIVATCPDASFAVGKGGSVSASATDADSIVNLVSAQGTWPTGIALSTWSPAITDGGKAEQLITVDTSLPAGTYNLGLKWDNNESQSATCSFKVVVSDVSADYTPIYKIQGSGSQSPLNGQTLMTQGIVTYLSDKGFYLQDRLGDGDASTSDGVYVYTGALPTVAVGDELRFTALVAENVFGDASRPTTQLKNLSGLVTLSTANQIAPTSVDLTRLAPNGLEAYEGMLVKLTGPIMVQQNYFLGRFGQLTLAAGGRLLNPTNVLRPGPDAQALLQSNLARAILLDDNNSAQNPNPVPFMKQGDTVRAGDTIESLTGVIDFGPATASNPGPSLYKLQPVGKPAFTRSNPRPLTPPEVGGNVRVASANVLNFFTTFRDGNTADGKTGQGCSLGGVSNKTNCRGADDATEFKRQRDKIIATLSALNADVVGLMEIQNNGNVALQNLVDGLNAVMGAGTYAVGPLPSDTGDDAIRVALIYKPATLKPVGAVLSDTARINNRPTYAQGFQALNGERFAVAVNHFKSKGCGEATDKDLDQGDLQACYNDRRVQQAKALKAFGAKIKAAANTDDVIYLGDFNAYAQEDPINELTRDGAIVDLVGRFDPAHHSYVFDGFAGRLDHGLGSASLVPKVSGATSWSINADEPTVIDYNTNFNPAGYYQPTPFRSSDHDPMLMGLNLYKRVTGTAGRDVLVGTAGDDIIEGGIGADTLTGNGGRNQFVYSSLLDGTDTITDFKPGVDQLVLSKLMQSLGVNSAAPLADGHVTCTAHTTGALIGVDQDGASGPVKSRAVVLLKGVNCGAVKADSFKF